MFAGGMALPFPFDSVGLVSFPAEFFSLSGACVGTVTSVVLGGGAAVGGVRLGGRASTDGLGVETSGGGGNNAVWNSR